MRFLSLITTFMATTAIAVPASLALRPDVTAIDAAVDAAVAAEAADGKPLLWCYICALWYEQCLDTQATPDICSCLTAYYGDGRCRTTDCGFSC